MVADVALAVAQEEAAESPAEKLNDVNEANENEPEPEEEKNLLIVEIDGQGALNCIAVKVSQTTYFEVTQGDARERHTRRKSPVGVADRPSHHVKTVGLELGGEDDVQQEELQEHIQDVQQFDQQIEEDQIRAESARKHEVILTCGLQSIVQSLICFLCLFTL